MTYKVTGRIREAESGLGVPNLRVKVMDKDRFSDDKLGEEVSTDATGQFMVTYEAKEFRKLPGLRGGGADLYLVVRAPDRSTVLYTSADQVRRNAGKAEHFEIEIDKKTLGDLAPQPLRAEEETTRAGEAPSTASSPLTGNPVEEIPAREAEQINEIADLTVKMLDRRYPAPKRILRGTHAKAHGCVRALFEVNADIDKELQIGLFANLGKTYSAWIRFSNCKVRIEPDLEDEKHQSRGMAVKILDVGGEVLLDDKGAQHQDFLMLNEQPAFVFANVVDYLHLTKVMHEHNDDVIPFFAPLRDPSGVSNEELQRIGRSAKLAKQIEQIPVANPLEVQYFSAAPFLFGPDRVMKFSAKSCAGEKPQVVPENPSENYLRETLIETMRRDEDVCFDFMVQVRGKDEAGLNIENASTEWDEQQFPFIKVAKITIPAPQKDIDSPAAIEQCERLEFSPWHSLVEHRPLGGINRLRKAVYIASQAHRASRPGKPEHQPEDEVTRMTTHVADYLAISDTGERLRGGDSHDFEFTLPASADLDQDAVFALKVNVYGSFERLSTKIEINGEQVLRVIQQEESYQTLHEVIEPGILVQGVNKATIKVDDDERAGRGWVKFEDLVLWFRSKAVAATAAQPVAPTLEAAPAAGITIDSGSFITWQGKHENWNLLHGGGERKSRQHVNFAQSFSEIPQVVVNLMMLDIASNRNSRLRVEAENITQEGFDAVFYTWADTRVYGAGVSWMAYGLGSEPLSGAQVQARLAKYTDDVLVTSESDCQLEAFHIPVRPGKFDEASFRTALGMTSEAREHQVYSFKDADDEKDFGRIRGNSSEQLVQLIKMHLVDVKEVIVNPKPDDCQYPYYLVGRASDGSLVGLKGMLVWT